MRKANRPQVPCPDCGSVRVSSQGFKATKQDGKKRRFLCLSCGRSFYHNKYSMTDKITSGGVILMETNISDPNVKLRRRFMELAAMFKEVGKGTAETLHIIMNKFVLQMGVKLNTAQEYVNRLEGAGLLLIKGGSGDWEYNEDAEWELFRITI